MKRLEQGTILRIPLLMDLGYTYAKYIDLTKISSKVSMPEIIKVYDKLTSDKNLEISTLDSCEYLLNPILVAGLRPTLKKGIWDNLGKISLNEGDLQIPSFKRGNETYEDIELGKWYLVKNVDTNNVKEVEYDDVEFLQTYAGVGSGSIERCLTMYFLQRNGEKVSDYFDLDNDEYKWDYLQVQTNKMIL